MYLTSLHKWIQVNEMDINIRKGIKQQKHKHVFVQGRTNPNSTFSLILSNNNIFSSNIHLSSKCCISGTKVNKLVINLASENATLQKTLLIF